MDIKSKMKTATIMSFVIVVLTAIISLAFFEAGPAAIIRNSIMAVAIFIIVYVAWLKINSSYEKFFRQGMGR